MSRSTLIAAAAACILAVPAAAQSPATKDAAAVAAPSHKHYETPPAPAQAGPQRRAGAAPAEPRLAHVPGVDEERRRAAVHEPGPEPRLRVQPRRGAARVPRGGAARPDAGDGLLGPGAGPRAQHQRGDGAQRRAARRRAREEGARRSPRRATPREQALIEALDAALLGQGRAPRRQRPGLRRRDARACTSSSPTTSTSRCSTSSR